MILTSRACGLAPKDWRIQQLFALNYITFNMLEAAKLSLNQAIALNPNLVTAHKNLGNSRPKT